MNSIRAGASASKATKDPPNLAWEDVSGDPRSRFYVVGGKERKNKMTHTLIGITAATYIAQIAIPKVTSMGLKVSSKILEGEELYRLVTPIFLHGNLQHIFTNMASLLRIGGNVEHLFGSGRYLASYIVAGVAGNVCSALASPTNSLGASGSVFGIIGAFAVFLTRNRDFLGAAGRQVSNSVLQTMFLNLVMGFFQKSIDQWAHLGGALGGAAMAFLIGPRLFYTRTPNGKLTVVDRPFWRAPLAAETIPSKISLKCKQLVSKILRRPAPVLPATMTLESVAVAPEPEPTVSKKAVVVTAKKSSEWTIIRLWNRLFY